MKAIVNLLLVALFMFLGCILGTLFGAFAGWVVGLIFGKTILSFFAAIGITGFKMWQIGASLGFIGGFFNSSTNVRTSN